MTCSRSNLFRRLADLATEQAIAYGELADLEDLADPEASKPRRIRGRGSMLLPPDTVPSELDRERARASIRKAGLERVR